MPHAEASGHPRCRFAACRSCPRRSGRHAGSGANHRPVIPRQQRHHALFARTPAIGNSVLPSDRQVERQSAYFQRLDANKDGVVTLEEFMAQADRNFARCDVNKDGKTDVNECRQALQRSQTQR